MILSVQYPLWISDKLIVLSNKFCQFWKLGRNFSFNENRCHFASLSQLSHLFDVVSGRRKIQYTVQCVNTVMVVLNTSHRHYYDFYSGATSGLFRRYIALPILQFETRLKNRQIVERALRDRINDWRETKREREKERIEFTAALRHFVGYYPISFDKFQDRFSNVSPVDKTA